MKRLMFAFMAVALISTAGSCKRCGYCVNAHGEKGIGICENNSVFSSPADLVAGSAAYIQAQSNCEASGSTWVEE